jgi:acyl-CoA synthetase (AMP-forming)/AMP-acid ligase II
VTDQIDRNLFSVLARQAQGPHRHREAVRINDDACDFAALAERATRVGNALLTLGLVPGDRVGVLLRNSLEWVELLFAMAQTGLVCVPINVLLSPVEVSKLCDDADVRAFVLDDSGAQAYERLPEAPFLTVCVGEVEVAPSSSRVVTYDELLTGSAVFSGRGPSLHDPLIFYYTSGTTGLPKGSVHTHNGVLWNAFHQIPDLGVGRGEVYLVVPSLSWAAGFNDVMISALWAGGRSVLMPTGGVTMERIVETVERNGVTRALLVPTLLKQLVLDEPLQQRLRDSSMRSILTGSEPVPLPVISSLMDAIPNVAIMQGYGLSEFPTVATMLSAEEAVPHVGTAGRPTSVTDLAVLTSSGEVAREGEGEVLLRSPATMQEYWRRPAETAEAFVDGWLHTGDLGRVDAEGFLTITGRKKDMIISGGMNIYPSEIESVLYRVQGVREASVVGVPDERWGEVPVAVIVANADFVTDDLDALCVQELSSYKRPRHVLVRQDELPKSPTGKVLKRELSPWATDQLRGAR